ncbi:MAG: hypothetical protein LBJ16_04250 [Holosporaceae bacterium]|nr:hypothetical protein [Holosporaceae bacterium]
MVHEDPSTEATQKLPKERMFRKKSIAVPPDRSAESTGSGQVLHSRNIRCHNSGMSQRAADPALPALSHGHQL